MKKRGAALRRDHSLRLLYASLMNLLEFHIFQRQKCMIECKQITNIWNALELLPHFYSISSLDKIGVNFSSMKMFRLR